MTVGTGSGQWGQDRISTMVGMLGRLQYSYADKYMASASIRRDGSSKFSEENRWGLFPSLSVGWNISEESFFDRFRWLVNSLKLRFSYGTTGNQNFLIIHTHQLYTKTTTILLVPELPKFLQMVLPNWDLPIRM